MENMNVFGRLDNFGVTFALALALVFSPLCDAAEQEVTAAAVPPAQPQVSATVPGQEPDRAGAPARHESTDATSGATAVDGSSGATRVDGSSGATEAADQRQSGRHGRRGQGRDRLSRSSEQHSAREEQ